MENRDAVGAVWTKPKGGSVLAGVERRTLCYTPEQLRAIATMAEAQGRLSRVVVCLRPSEAAEMGVTL